MMAKAYDTKHRDLLRQALLIRRFEEKLLALFRDGEIAGTVHTCIGQEFAGIAVARALRRGDVVFSNHRGHGHFLAWIGDLPGLLAEVMGRARGICGGLGGSQHLHAPGFYSNGIQGGMTPIAVGHAMAQKRLGSGNICVAFVGDGTLGEGVLYESLNLASKWQAPMLVVVESNGIAQTTRTADAVAGSVEGRARAFDLPYRCADTTDWLDLVNQAGAAIQEVRDRSQPQVLEIRTARLMPHSKGDDSRPSHEVESLRQRDPLHRFLSDYPDEARELVESVDAEIASAVLEARRSDRLAHNPGPDLRPKQNVQWKSSHCEPTRIVTAIHRALSDAFTTDDGLIMIGEDLHAPYGGAFKVTQDMSMRFPGRVISTPISESAIIGAGTGLALAGFKTIVEIMFGDFITLGFDQLINHASKFPYMYHEQVQVPLVIRVPMGGKRGYGPTHSQSLEKHLLGVPNLNILALNYRLDPQDLYRRLFASVCCPTVVIENKVLYTQFLTDEPPAGFQALCSDETFPTIWITPATGVPDVTLLCYGETLADCETAATAAFDEHEVLCEIICPCQLHPFNIAPLLESVRRSKRLIVVEEGIGVAGFGTEAIARLMENNAPLQHVRRVFSEGYIPSSRELELQVIPNAQRILAAIRVTING